MKLDRNEGVYESLGISIIYQQLHCKAAASIAARFKKQLIEAYTSVRGIGPWGDPMYSQPGIMVSGESSRSSTGKRAPTLPRLQSITLKWNWNESCSITLWVD